MDGYSVGVRRRSSNKRGPYGHKSDSRIRECLIE